MELRNKLKILFYRADICFRIRIYYKIFHFLIHYLIAGTNNFFLSLVCSIFADRIRSMDRNRHPNQNGQVPNGNRLEYADESAKKKKKWSLGGLFKRRRSKSSDTDSSTEVDVKKKGFLGRSNRRKGGSHRVVGKFEAKILKDGVCQNGTPPSTLIETYDSSPNHVMKNRLGNGAMPAKPDPVEAKGSSGSLDTANRRHLIKARAEARRGQMEDASSSDEYTSSRTSNNSLQRCSGDPCRSSASSLSRKSRAARTDRYLRRQYREEDGRCCSNSELGSTPVGSPKNRWVAKVVYQQSYLSPPYTTHTQSADCSPINSPPTTKRPDYSSSLPSKPTGDMFRILHPKPSNLSNGPVTYGHIQAPQSVESLSRSSPPPPPPRNPYNRKVIYPSNGYPNNRPSSYAFDAHAHPSEIAAYLNRPVGYHIEPESSLRLTNSSVELRRNDQRVSYPIDCVPKKYYADRKPRSRNPICLANEKENIVGLDPPPQAGFTTVAATKKSAPRCTPLQVHEERPCNSPLQIREEGSPYSLQNHRDSKQLPISKANEIGIPVTTPSNQLIMNGRVGSLPKPDRPLSVVSERSDELLDNEVMKTSTPNSAPSKNTKTKPKNLEEALDELEEIYNSLKLSDEDLLDRAERRDLQCSLRMNPNFSRYSWSDLEKSDDVMDCSRISSADYLSSGLLSPRLPCGRKSAIPDTVADDMANRKLNKKESADPRTNSNVISKSGSFLLMSPALSPPPLVNVSPGTLQIHKEPDITLDDVVFRNIKQSNNTLKVLDPQPPFGIPIGPVSPAPNSDYLHAVPGEKYRSTFNPSRTPDVVKDDLAFRNLRKDVYGSTDIVRPQFAVPSADAKKRRAIRSLSANVVSLLGGATAHSERVSSDNEDSDALVDMNGNSIKPNRCASYNDLPDALENLNAQKRALLRNCNECLDSQSKIADEAKILRLKLRELEAIPPPSVTLAAEEKTNPASAAPAKETFVKRVALHKPITLNKFTIPPDTTVNGADMAAVADELVQDQCATLQSAAYDETAEDANEESTCQPKNLCEKLRWNSVLCSQYQPKRAILGECDVVDCAIAKTDAENSSSGVSSTSETPDSCRKLTTGTLPHNKEGDRVAEVATAAAAAPAASAKTASSSSLSNACEQFARELDAVNGNGTAASVAVACNSEIGDPCRRKVANGVGSSPSKHHEHCSRIEIRLSTPEPEGLFSNFFPNVVSNVDVFFFAFIIYAVACLHQFLFTSFSLIEVLLLIVSIIAYHTTDRY